MIVTQANIQAERRGWASVIDGRVFSHGGPGHPVAVISTILARWEAGRS